VIFLNESKIKVVIVDDNIEVTYLLKSFLAKCDDIEVVGNAMDGSEAIQLINCLSPDVVILDIVMPELDGLGVLEYFNSLSIIRKPLFIILTALGLSNITKMAVEAGAEYVMLKPFDPETLIVRIRKLVEGRENKNIILPENLTNRIQYIFQNLGIPENLKGYNYLIEAIKIVFVDLNHINSITKTIYPTIAQRNDTTAMRVEKAIRSTIEISWTKGNLEKIEEIFGKSEKIRPSNTEFITGIYEYMTKDSRRWNY